MTGAPSSRVGASAGAANDPTPEPTDDEPAVLGAAATLPDQQRRRPTRRERREAGPWATRRRPRGAAHRGNVQQSMRRATATSSTSSRPVPPPRPHWCRTSSRCGNGGASWSSWLAQASEQTGEHHPGAPVGSHRPAVPGPPVLPAVHHHSARWPPDRLPPHPDRGFFLFQLATSALSERGRSIRGSKSFMLNSTFPRAVFPVTSVYASVIRFAPAVFVYAVFHVTLGAPTGPRAPAAARDVRRSSS